MSRKLPRSWRFLLRAAALLLLTLIGADVAADSGCAIVGLDPTTGAAWSTAGGEGNTDPCAAGCVSDCFCCRLSEPAASLSLLAPAAPFLGVALDSPFGLSAGTCRLPFLPPIARS